MIDWPIVQVVPFQNTDDCIWQDGKPRCPQHPGTCLVRARSVGIKRNGHVCARCMREVVEARAVLDDATG